MLKLGWIGLGNMGVPMVRNLLKKGWDVSVWNRTESKARTLLGEGAVWAESPAQLAETCDAVFTMVTNGTALKSICLSENGLCETLTENKIIIDMSTISPEDSAAVNEAVKSAGSSFLRAPVTGSTVFAEKGQLGILVSGRRAAYDEMLPCFKALGSKQFYLGAAEEARSMKLALNMMIGTSMQMLAETMVLAEKSGLDWKQSLEVIAGSAAGSPLIGYKVNPVSERNYNPAFSIKLMEKDFDLAIAEARRLGVSVPVTAATREQLASADARGKADRDISVLVELAEEMSGLKKD